RLIVQVRIGDDDVALREHTRVGDRRCCSLHGVRPRVRAAPVRRVTERAGPTVPASVLWPSVELARQGLKVNHQFPSRLVAAVGLFLQALEGDPLELWWHVVVQPGDRWGLAMHDLIDDLGKTRTGKRLSASGELVQYDPKAKDVAAMIEVV